MIEQPHPLSDDFDWSEPPRDDNGVLMEPSPYITGCDEFRDENGFLVIPAGTKITFEIEKPVIPFPPPGPGGKIGTWVVVGGEWEQVR